MSTQKRARDQSDNDDLRPEYDFAALGRGVRGKYLERARAGTNLVLLDPDVAEAFPTQDSVNRALRLLSEVATATASVQPGRTEGGRQRAKSAKPTSVQAAPGTRGERRRTESGALREKRADTHVGTIEEQYNRDFGVRSDMRLDTLLEREGVGSLGELLKRHSARSRRSRKKPA